MASALADAFGEAVDALGVVAVVAEVVAGDEPVDAVAGAAGLDVAGFAAGLPATGQRDGVLDGGALLFGDVLRVGQTKRSDRLGVEVDFAAGRVEGDGEAVVVMDLGDVAEAAVLDAGLASRMVLGASGLPILLPPPWDSLRCQVRITSGVTSRTLRSPSHGRM